MIRHGGRRNPYYRKMHQLIEQVNTGWTRSSTNNVGTLDTDYVNLVQPVVPAGLMGLNSSVLIKLDWVHNATITRKFMSVDFGATNIAAVDINNLNTYKGGKMVHEVLNLNSLVSQKTLNSSTYGAATNDYIPSAIDTSADVIISIKCKWGAQIVGEAITLVGYSIWHQPGS